jgi:uncharacterized protein (UPF0335 family)
MTVTSKPNFARDQLKAFIERIERLESEKADLANDIREVYAESKGNGFDVKAIRTIIKMRKQDADERAEEEAILDTYLQALGMLPLFEHANNRDNDDTKVTITSGESTVETTLGTIKQASDTIKAKRKKPNLSIIAAG